MLNNNILNVFLFLGVIAYNTERGKTHFRAKPYRLCAEMRLFLRLVTEYFIELVGLIQPNSFFGHFQGGEFVMGVVFKE